MNIKLISFNIRNSDDENGHSIEERAPRLMESIKSRDPDIIGIQEYRPKWEHFFENVLSCDYEIFNKYRCDEKPEASPILWKKDKFECLKKGYTIGKHDRYILPVRHIYR